MIGKHIALSPKPKILLNCKLLKMKSPQISYQIPPQFNRLTSIMAELEFQYSVIDAIDSSSDPSLYKTKIVSLKILGHGLLEIYEEAVYIHANTTRLLKIRRGMAVELNSSYLKCLEIALDLFIHRNKWGDWYKSAMAAHRTAGTINKFAPNNIIYKKVTADLKKLLGRKLVGSDYPAWVQLLRDGYPMPPVITPTRNTKKSSNKPLKPIAGIATVERESPWPESTARKKFKEFAGCSPTKKRNNSLVK